MAVWRRRGGRPSVREAEVELLERAMALTMAERDRERELVARLAEELRRRDETNKRLLDRAEKAEARVAELQAHDPALEAVKQRFAAIRADRDQ